MTFYILWALQYIHCKAFSNDLETPSLNLWKAKNLENLKNIFLSPRRCHLDHHIP